MDELYELAMNQNFVPVTDDEGIFIGIVTRKNIIKYFVASRTGKKFTAPLKSKFISGKPKSVSE